MDSRTSFGRWQARRAGRQTAQNLPAPSSPNPTAAAGATRPGTALGRVFERPERQRNIAAFDGFRALAVLWVLIYHSWLFRCALYDGHCEPSRTGEPLAVTAMGLVAGHGDLGVDVFLGLSGFLILDMLLGALRNTERGSAAAFGRFLVRRFLRIYPALAVMIPLNFLFFFYYYEPSLQGLANPLAAGCAHHAWSNYLLLNNFSSLGGTLLDFQDGRIGCMPWTWSVSMEWQFYAVSPLLALYFIRTRARTRAREARVRWWTGTGLAVAVLALSQLVQIAITFWLRLYEQDISTPRLDEYMTWLYGNSLARCPAYLCGMAAAAYVHHARAGATPRVERTAATREIPLRPATELRAKPGRIFAWAVRLSLMALPFFTVVGVLPLYPSTGFNFFLVAFGRMLFGVATGVLLVAAALPESAPRRWVRFLAHRFWGPISLVSYSMYLWQFAAIESARWLYTSLGVQPYEGLLLWLGFALLSCALAFVFAVPSYWLVERPGLSVRPAA